jgi:protein CpxP
MRAKTLLITAAMFIAGFGGVWAQGGGGPHGPAARQMFGRMFRNLDLTDQQRTEIRKVLETERSLMQPIHQQLRENREALKAATKDGQFNEAEVTKLAQKQGDLMAQMIVSRERVQSQIWQILTPEQRDKLAQWREKHQGGRGQLGAGPMFRRGLRNNQ